MKNCISFLNENFIKILNKWKEIKGNSKISNISMALYLISVIIISVLLSGCVQPNGKIAGGLVINLDAPESVRANQEFSVFLELSNKGDQDYKILVDFFDVGMFKKRTECKKEFELKSGFEQHVDCKLVFETEKAITRDIDEMIYALIRYNTKFSMVRSFVIMTQQEYENRRITNRLEELSKRFIESNGDLEVTLELSENPIVARGVESYLYIKIKNVGDGFASDLKKEDIEIKVVPSFPISCDIDEKISIERGAANIPCKINVKNLKESYLNAYVIINIKYEYEMKKDAKIKIFK